MSTRELRQRRRAALVRKRRETPLRMGKEGQRPLRCRRGVVDCLGTEDLPQSVETGKTGFGWVMRARV
jgi:hypothetical protein